MTVERKAWKVLLTILKYLAGTVLTVVALAVFAQMLVDVALGSGTPKKTPDAGGSNAAIMDRFEMKMNNDISSALDGVLAIEKVYWLSDDDLVAPEPDQSCYGTAKSPAELGWLLEEAQEILDGQETLFDTEIQTYSDSVVNYYLDETIFVVTWKEKRDNAIYTFSEVKIAHPSQFRRFLAGGEYGSSKQFKTTEMAASVNAVVASAGDFYGYRNYGIIVYDGVVRRANSVYTETCYIDDKGDLLFSKRYELRTKAEAQAFVDENNIRFSLSFGPILIQDGVRCDPKTYAFGQVEDKYARAALCQRDELHYLLVTVNSEARHRNMPTINDFTDQIVTLGCKHAYALDGGQTATIAMNDKLVNAVLSGSQRQISDIIYFATAVPDGG